MTELIRTLQRGNAANAAANFGKAEVGLQAGHAYGQNIVAGFSEVPTLDLAPVYVRLGGIEGGFLMDATSYAWDAQGLVVSSDLMLLGVTGWYGAAPPASSWLRLPVPSAGLQQTPEPLLETAAKANSIAIPNGFNPADPASVAAALALLPANGSDTFSKVQPDNLGLIGPSLEIELLDVSTGASVVAVDYNYALVLPAESFSLATGGVAVVVDGTPVPAAVITLATMAPAIDAGTAVAVPAAAVTLQRLAPEVDAAAVRVSVPAAAVLIDPAVPGISTSASVVAPAADVSVAALAPVIDAGATEVLVPVAGMALIAVPPAVDAGEPDYWGDWVMQQYGWQADIYPDGWAG